MNWESLINRDQYQLSLDFKLNFGKYRGRTIDEILDEDPTYIRWCIDNIYWFKLSKEDEETVRTYADYCDREMEEYEDWGAWGDLF